ncbi:MAG: type II toxin-antitoxin system RelE/ParE family toxin [Pseudomonadota bacterium]
MPTFRVSKATVADLEQIGRYTEHTWGADQRRAYLNGLNDQFVALSERPLAAPERTEFNPPVRIHHHGKHLIVYIIEDDGIFVLRVLHERMNVPAQLFP